MRVEGCLGLGLRIRKLYAFGCTVSGLGLGGTGSLVLDPLPL